MTKAKFISFCKHYRSKVSRINSLSLMPLTKSGWELVYKK